MGDGYWVRNALKAYLEDPTTERLAQIVEHVADALDELWLNKVDELDAG